MSELYVEYPLEFWCNNYGISSADVVFLGVPFDGTSTGRVGSREAPNMIRSMSYNLETFSSLLKRDLKDLKIADYGNVTVCPGETSESLNRIEATVSDIKNKFPVVIGGEHIITLPVVKSLLRRYPDLKILHFDAHLDLKDDYLGNNLSHVTVMKRIFEILGKDRIIQVGARSFSPEEMEFAKKNLILKSLERLKEYEINGPVYITMDMDVFDPAFAPGVSTPAPGGLNPLEFLEFLGFIGNAKNRMDVIGFDVVETCPPHDNGSVTSLLAARIIKEILLAFK